MKAFNQQPTLQKSGIIFIGKFIAFERQCEVQFENSVQKLAKELFEIIYSEAIRISDKYSPSSTSNIMSRINRGTAESIIVDEETAGLLDFADACFTLSDGRFDISCVALQPLINEPHISQKSGWNKIRWDSPRLRLLQGMKLNFSAIDKEHAADRCMALASEISSIPILINLGGNILANKPHSSTNDWWIDIPTNQSEIQPLQIDAGGVATACSYSDRLYYDGRNGHPFTSLHKSITVAADSCTEAGMLATLAMLYGDKAKAFLIQQHAKYWIHN